VLTELVFHDFGQKQMQCYHLVNPYPVRWGTLLPAIMPLLESDGGNANEPKIVSFPQWVQALQKASEHGDTTTMPAIKLLDFFRELSSKAVHIPRARAATLDVKQTARASKTLQAAEAVNVAWMRLWLKQWGL
jgi:hypothetical protein